MIEIHTVKEPLSKIIEEIKKIQSPNVIVIVSSQNDLVSKKHKPTAQAPVKFITKVSDTEVVSKLMLIGFKPYCNGFRYIREALKIIVAEPDMINQITKTLYPQLAEKFDSAPSNIERCIRYSIEDTWKNGNMDKIDEIFGFTVSKMRGRPTNSEFLATMSQAIRMGFI